MKYATFKAKNKETFEAVSLSGGINTTEREDKINNNQFVSGTNLCLENSKLETRKGLSPISGTIVGEYDIFGDMEKGMTITDYQINLDGKNGKICYNIWSDTVSYQILNIYFLSSDGDFSSLGNIRVSRLDSSTFFKIQNVLFLFGAKQNGDGIYCFISRLNQEGAVEENTYSIYEYKSTNNTWSIIDNSMFYTPIVYMNGRGSKYDYASELTTVFEDSPIFPEAQNLLGGRFMAFFTSDAYSSHFDLPIKNLETSSTITCKVYRNDTEYCVFTIPADQSSVTTYFFGYYVTFTCNRQTGHFSFTCGDDEYPPPKTPSLKGNNIQVTAVKYPEHENDRIIGSKGAAYYNSRNYLYGNKIKKNEVYASKADNPLYFPATMKTAVGNTDSPITTLKIKGDNVFAIKEEGIFKINTSSETKKQSVDIPLGISREYSSPDTLKNTAVHLGNGSVLENTVTVCDNSILWLGKNKKIYALINDKDVCLVSSPIENIIETFTSSQLNNAFAVYSKGKYMLFIGNNVLVLNIQSETKEYKFENSLYSNFNKSLSWYRYILPESTKYLTAQDTNKGLRIFCSNTIGNYNFLSSLSAQKDIELDFSGATPVQRETVIPFTLRSKNYDFSTPLKYKEIKSIYFDIGGDGIYKVLIGDSYNESEQNVKLSSVSNAVVKIYPFLPPVKNVQFSVSGKAPFNISQATFEYKLKG